VKDELAGMAEAAISGLTGQDRTPGGTGTL
jgi:hypothetical protein